VAGRVDLPHFLDAQAVGLWVFAFIQLEFCNELLAQMATRTLGKDGVLAVQFHAQLEVCGRLAFFADAQIAGGDSFDRAIGVVQHFSRGEAREYFHT
jgi:hypothetical protein